MGFQVIHKQQLEYLTAQVICGEVVHCFSTRYGGVSEGSLASLNLGVHRGDEFSNVVENYRILGQAVGFRSEETVFNRQLHTDIVARVGKKDCGNGLFSSVEQPRDATITNEPHVALVAFGADCPTVLLHDPVTGAIGAVHSGWRGTAMGIVKKTVEAMQREYGTNPKDVQAAIGPCIGVCCFETREDVPQAMLAALGTAAEPALISVGEKFHVDLKLLNRIWLTQAGVEQVDVCGECTCCQPQRFWSHRRVGDARGSLAAIIMRKGGEGV